jgi:integrase
VKRLRGHLERFGYGRDGRLFVGPRGGIPSQDRYGDTWKAARKGGLTATELEHRPYNLRHACVSGWLAAGVDPAQVAEWGPHVETLLRIYAKCLDGNAERAKKLILESLPAEDEEPTGESDEDQDGRGVGGQESDQNLTGEP